ncbi:hypothetical protein [Nitrosopumilus piranensis]|nr:hypothetical protein [Nitrosopumilus piranensis]
MKQSNTVFGLSIGAIFAISVITISVMPTAMAKSDATGQPDLIAILTAIDGSSSDPKGKAMFWFDDDSNPTSIRYQIVLNKIDVSGNDGKGLTESLEKVHVHYAPEGVHNAMHLYNVLGPADDINDGKTAGNTLSGVWDEADVWPNWDEHGMPMHHSSKPLTAVNPNGNTILKNLCTGNTDVNVHLHGDVPYIRGIIETNSDACTNLG